MMFTIYLELKFLLTNGTWTMFSSGQKLKDQVTLFNVGKTPPVSPQISMSDESGIDTTF